jgi:hypothetical protein
MRDTRSTGLLDPNTHAPDGLPGLASAVQEAARVLSPDAEGNAWRLPPQAGRTTNVVVATSVMLTFISFWRAAASVLNDLGSSAFYVGDIAEQAIGRAALWFILGVMLFSYAVRAVYIESCAMFTRGGVSRVVKEALGGTLAKLSVSALLFDYILTGPISGGAAGQCIVGLLAQTLTTFVCHRRCGQCSTPIASPMPSHRQCSCSRSSTSSRCGWISEIGFPRRRCTCPSRISSTVSRNPPRRSD